MLSGIEKPPRLLEPRPTVLSTRPSQYGTQPRPYSAEMTCSVGNRSSTPEAMMTASDFCTSCAAMIGRSTRFSRPNSYLGRSIPVGGWRLTGIPSSSALLQKTSYMSRWYGWSSGGDAQIIAPLSPIFAHRSSSSAPSFGSYSEISASPFSRSGA